MTLNRTPAHVLHALRVKNLSSYLLFTKTGSNIHVSIRGKTVCKPAETPHYWTDDINCKYLKWSVGTTYNRYQYTICERCFHYACKILETVPNIDRPWSTPKTLNTREVRWGCVFLITEHKIERGEGVGSMTKVVTSVTKRCGKPTLDPKGFCKGHNKMVQRIIKVLDPDSARLVVTFLDSM